MQGWAQSELEELQRALTMLGLPSDYNHCRHFQVLIQAQRIYTERYDKYRDIPIREMGAKGCLVQARTCVGRLWAKFGPGSVAKKHVKHGYQLDDAYDGINYVVHFVNQMYAKNPDGEWWKRGGS